MRTKITCSAFFDSVVVLVTGKQKTILMCVERVLKFIIDFDTPRSRRRLGWGAAELLRSGPEILERSDPGELPGGVPEPHVDPGQVNS